MTVSSSDASPPLIAWTSPCTKTFEASSAEICFQPTIFPFLTVATRMPPAFIHRASSRAWSPSRSTSR